MHRKIIICYLLLLQALMVNAQTAAVAIPFRVGEKFGVVNSAGVFIIKPQFDWIDINNYRDKLLIGYTVKNGAALSSLIYQNKILIADKPYSSYYLTNGLFTAVSFTITDARNPEFDKRFIVRNDVYTTDGKKLLPGVYKDVGVLHSIEEDKLNQTLITTTDTLLRNSLYLYDRTLKKITETYVSNSSYMRVTDNAEYNYRNRSYTIIYKDAQGIGHQLLIVNDGKVLTLKYDKPASILPDRPRGYDRTLDFPDWHKTFTGTPAPIKDSSSRTINTFGIKRGYYYLPKKIEQLENTITMATNIVVTTKAGRGIMYEEKPGFVIPAVYDDVYGAEFEGDGGGYITRLNGKYGICFYANNSFVIDKPIFDKIPLLITGYFNNGSPLVKLYDSTGRFFCYANRSGKMYYAVK